MANWKRCAWRKCRGRFETEYDNKRYCSKACREAANEERRQLKTAEAQERQGFKMCGWCGVRKPLGRFPDSRNGVYSGHPFKVCLDCMPFEAPVRETRGAPCGQDTSTLIEGEVFLEFSEPTCPLYDNCRERLRLLMDPPCQVPDRRVLQTYFSLSKADQEYVEKLYEVRLDENWEPAPDSIWNYLGYYRLEVAAQPAYAYAGGD